MKERGRKLGGGERDGRGGRQEERGMVEEEDK